MKKLLIAGNWKLYIDEATAAKKLTSSLKRAASQLKGVDIVLFPPATLISDVAAVTKKTSLALGAQTISPFGEGAYTGYVSAEAVKKAGASWVLVGHSEQRATQIDGVPGAGTRDDVVAKQVDAANAAGLKVMLCIGEDERDPAGAHFARIEEQLSVALAHYPKNAAKLAIAYEPVWAIGKSSAEAMKPGDLEEMSIFIRRTLTELFDRATAAKIPILYGGSVDATNAHELLVHGAVAGFLVGRASTDAGSFISLLKAVR